MLAKQILVFFICIVAISIAFVDDLVCMGGRDVFLIGFRGEVYSDVRFVLRSDTVAWN